MVRVDSDPNYEDSAATEDLNEFFEQVNGTGEEEEGGDDDQDEDR